MAPAFGTLMENTCRASSGLQSPGLSVSRSHHTVVRQVVITALAAVLASKASSAFPRGVLPSQSNKSPARRLTLFSLTGSSNSSFPSFLGPPLRWYWFGNSSFTSRARPLMLSPPDPLIAKPSEAPLILNPPPFEGNSSTPAFDAPFLDLVLSMEMDFRANRSARSSSFLASMAWLRRWCDRGLVCAALRRSAFKRFAAAALARLFAMSVGGRKGGAGSVDMEVSASAEDLEGKRSRRSERNPPPDFGGVVDEKSSLPALLTRGAARS